MDRRKLLRVLVTLEIFMQGIAWLVLPRFNGRLPQALRDFQSSQYADQIMNNTSLVNLIGMALILALYLTGIVGLTNFRVWGVYSYVAALVLGIVSSLATGGYDIAHVSASLFRYIFSINTGLILGLAFFGGTIFPPKANGQSH